MVLLRIVTLATLAHASAAFKLQLARNQTADHHAAISAVSRTVSFGRGTSAPATTASSSVCSGARGDEGEMERVSASGDASRRVRSRLGRSRSVLSVLSASGW